jgi:hypothetical protein
MIVFCADCQSGNRSPFQLVTSAPMIADGAGRMKALRLASRITASQTRRPATATSTAGA